MQVTNARVSCIDNRSNGREASRLTHNTNCLVNEPSSVPIAILDPKSFCIVGASKSFYQVCGKIAGDVSIDKIFGKLWVLKANAVLVEQKQTQWVAECIVNSNGREQLYLVEATAVCGDTFDVKWISTALKNTSVSDENAEIESMFESSYVQYARSNTVGEMTTMLAHELNQPLTAILNYTDTCRHLLKGGAYSVKELDAALAEIENMTHRTSHTLDRIRKMVTHKKTVKEYASVNVLVEDAMCVAKHKLRMSRIAVEVDLAENLPMVFVDSIQIQQVILNLLINAIDAMERDNTPIDGRLAISTSLQNERVVAIRVADNGPGLDVDVIGKLFSPFVTTKPEGLGVGLSICKRLADAHGGELSIEANATRGVTATLTLPAREDV